MRSAITAERLCLALLFALFVGFTWRGLTMFYTGDDLMNTYFAWQIAPWKILKSELLLWMPIYRPLGAIVYRAFYGAFGFHPEPLYAFCWLLLCINVFAAWQFFRTVADSGREALIALAVTLVHGNFRDLYLSSGTVYDRLCFLFTALAVTVYVRARRKGPAISAQATALVCLFSILAMDSKESGVTVIAILAVWECIFVLPRVCRESRLGQWLKSVAPLYGLLLLLALIFVFGRVKRTPEIAIDNYQPHFSAALWLTRVSYYFGILAYGHISFQPFTAAVLLAILLLAALALRNRTMLFGWLFFVIAITPVALISIRLGYVLYVPMLGLGLYLAAAIAAIARRLARSVHAAPGAFEFAAFGLCLAAVLWFHIDNWPADFAKQNSPELRLTEQFRREYPDLPRGSHLLFDSDDFPPDSFDLLTNLRLLYADRSLVANRTHAPSDQQPDWRQSPHFDHVFALEQGRYVEMDPGDVRESLRLHTLRDFTVGRHVDFSHRDHGAYVVSGIKDYEGADAGRWTAPHAVLKFELYPADAALALKFWVPDFVAAPPLKTLSITINGAKIGSMPLTKDGTNDVRFPVPAADMTALDAQKPHNFTLVTLDIDRPYTKNGEQFGVILMEAGFDYSDPRVHKH
jgi:hypothetical protein